MKKTFLKIAIGAACLAAVCYFSKQDKANLSELASTNIEALAEGEGWINVQCYGWGTVDCYGRMVDTKIEGFSLE